MNRARLLAYATALSAMVGWSLIAPQPAQAQLLGSLIVTITSPADGSPVSGTVPVTASIITIISALTVRGVQFKLDGANLGAQDTSASYSVSWSTTTASNGSHTLTAVATDIFGVQWTSRPVTVTVSNASPPTITSFTPASGPVGTSVTISGTNFTDASAVLFNGTSASFTVNSATSIAATVPSGATTGPISVTTADSTASSAGSFTVGDTTPPTVTIDQAAGQADPTSAPPINFTAVFSKPVSGFTGAGVTLSGTAGGTKTATVSGGP